MKTALLLGTLVLLAGCENLAQRATAREELITAQLASAPFPHPKRAEGHKYKDVVYSAGEHYSDSTVAIFIPKGFRETGQIDFVVHFHGWKNHVAGVLERYKLVEQLTASGRNVVLVVPQGPKDAPDSFGGKLEDADGFKRFMAEVTHTLREKSGLKRRDFAIGQIILSGHSGGYQVISSILDRGGLTEHVSEVWLFDALYAQSDKFLAWFDAQHGRLFNIYTEHGGTKEQTEQMIAGLKARNVPLISVKENEVKPSELHAKKPIFVFTDLEHNDVLDKHQTFQTLLETSFLQERKR